MGYLHYHHHQKDEYYVHDDGSSNSNSGGSDSLSSLMGFISSAFDAVIPRVVSRAVHSFLSYYRYHDVPIDTYVGTLAVLLGLLCAVLLLHYYRYYCHYEYYYNAYGDENDDDDGDSNGDFDGGDDTNNGLSPADNSSTENAGNVGANGETAGWEGDDGAAVRRKNEAVDGVGCRNEQQIVSYDTKTFTYNIRPEEEVEEATRAAADGDETDDRQVEGSDTRRRMKSSAKEAEDSPPINAVLAAAQDKIDKINTATRARLEEKKEKKRDAQQQQQRQQQQVEDDENGTKEKVTEEGRKDEEGEREIGRGDDDERKEGEHPEHLLLRAISVSTASDLDDMMIMDLNSSGNDDERGTKRRNRSFMSAPADDQHSSGNAMAPAELKPVMNTPSLISNTHEDELLLEVSRDQSTETSAVIGGREVGGGTEEGGIAIMDESHTSMFPAASNDVSIDLVAGEQQQGKEKEKEKENEQEMQDDDGGGMELGMCAVSASTIIFLDDDEDVVAHAATIAQTNKTTSNGDSSRSNQNDHNSSSSSNKGETTTKQEQEQEDDEHQVLRSEASTETDKQQAQRMLKQQNGKKKKPKKKTKTADTAHDNTALRPTLMPSSLFQETRRKGKKDFKAPILDHFSPSSSSLHSSNRHKGNSTAAAAHQNGPRGEEDQHQEQQQHQPPPDSVSPPPTMPPVRGRLPLNRSRGSDLTLRATSALSSSSSSATHSGSTTTISPVAATMSSATSSTSMSATATVLSSKSASASNSNSNSPPSAPADAPLLSAAAAATGTSSAEYDWQKHSATRTRVFTDGGHRAQPWRTPTTASHEPKIFPEKSASASSSSMMMSPPLLWSLSNPSTAATLTNQTVTMSTVKPLELPPNSLEIGVNKEGQSGSTSGFRPDLQEEEEGTSTNSSANNKPGVRVVCPREDEGWARSPSVASSSSKRRRPRGIRNRNNKKVDRNTSNNQTPHSIGMGEDDTEDVYDDDDENESHEQQQHQESFSTFQLRYLAVYFFTHLADWMQGAYMYALYDSLGFDRSQIAWFYSVGYISSMFLGTVVGSLADKYGRKRVCFVYCIMHIIGAATKVSDSFMVQMFGRVTGGIATSLVFTCFESWMVTHHLRSGYAPRLVTNTFTKQTLVNGASALLGGFLAEIAADQWGYAGAFLVAIPPLGLSILLMLPWEENFGSAAAETAENSGFSGHHVAITGAVRAILTDWTLLSLALCEMLYEASMNVFIAVWTPAIATHWTSRYTPYGLIFSAFMAAYLVGSTLPELLTAGGGGDGGGDGGDDDRAAVDVDVDATTATVEGDSAFNQKKTINKQQNKEESPSPPSYPTSALVIPNEKTALMMKTFDAEVEVEIDTTTMTMDSSSQQQKQSFTAAADDTDSGSGNGNTTTASGSSSNSRSSSVTSSSNSKSMRFVAIPLHVVAATTFGLAGLYFKNKSLIFVLMTIFEVTVGAYFPTHATFRSIYVPDEQRAGVMAMFGLPMNALALSIIQSGLSTRTILLILCGVQVLALVWLMVFKRSITHPAAPAPKKRDIEGASAVESSSSSRKVCDDDVHDHRENIGGGEEGQQVGLNFTIPRPPSLLSSSSSSRPPPSVMTPPKVINYGSTGDDATAATTEAGTELSSQQGNMNLSAAGSGSLLQNYNHNHHHSGTFSTNSSRHTTPGGGGGGGGGGGATKGGGVGAARRTLLLSSAATHHSLLVPFSLDDLHSLSVSCCAANQTGSHSARPTPSKHSTPHHQSNQSNSNTSNTSRPTGKGKPFPRQSNRNRTTADDNTATESVVPGPTTGGPTLYGRGNSSLNLNNSRSSLQPSPIHEYERTATPIKPALKSTAQPRQPGQQ